jgi:hypothetical protein
VSRRKGTHYDTEDWHKYITPEVKWFVQEVTTQIDKIPEFYSEYILTPEEFKTLEKGGYPRWSKYYLQQPKKIYNIFFGLLGQKDFANIDFDTRSGKFIKNVLCALYKAKDLRKVTIPRDFEKYLEKIRPALMIRSIILSGVSLIRTGYPIDVLYREARKGNDEALLKLIEIDKTVISEKWIYKRIYKAQLLNQRWFFRDLGNAIGTIAVSPKYKYAKTSVVVAILWKFGLWRKLSFKQISDLLAEFNIAYLDYDVLRKFASRMRLKKRGKCDIK